MSYATKPAFIHAGSWNDETRKHPAMKWMEDYTHRFDDGAYAKLSSAEMGHAPGFVYQKSTGEVIEGADDAWKALAQTYAPFQSHVHDPIWLLCWETEKGWDMFGVAQVWYTLPAPPSATEKKMKGYGDKEWDGMAPGAFHFSYWKTGSGIELGRTEIFNDASPVIVQMIKRGMLKPEELGAM